MIRNIHFRFAAAALFALAAMPVWAQDVVGSAAGGLNTAMTGTWAPLICGIAIFLGAVGLIFGSGHALKGVCGAMVLGGILMLNANRIVSWLQAISG